MMTKKYITLILLIAGIILSCNDDFLDKKPLGEFSEIDVWNDINLVETFVNGTYRRLGIPFAINMLSNYVDETHFTPDWGTRDFNNCLLTPDWIPRWDDTWANANTELMTWEELYESVRKTNLFLSKIDEVPVDETTHDKKDRLTGEIYFLRAFFYHRLTNLYGGVPIIKNVYTLEDDYNIARNSYEECINLILEDLEKAIDLLPETVASEDDGRATMGAAMALKSRILLHAASDLHHDLSWAGGYDHPELLGYTNGSQENRWQAAKDAALDVMQLGIYDLYKKDPAPEDSIAMNYADIFLSYQTVEDIFVQHFTSTTDEDWDGYNPNLYCGSNGYHNWGNNCVLQELVDDYEMADGSKFDWENPTHATAPYQNREPRFYANVLYDGANWRERPTDAKNTIQATFTPPNTIQTGIFETWDDSTETIVEVCGLDTRCGPIEDWNGTYTGYYTRKFIDPTLDAQYNKQDLPWRFIRYAEILLNYAEACIEIGGAENETEAVNAINLIRTRAGLPDLNTGLSNEELLLACRHERRIELACEEHRFWDVRRWLIAEEAYQPVYSIVIRYPLLEDHTTASIPTYEISDSPFENRQWDNKCYLFPILRDELNRNELLVQNPLY